MMSVRAPESKDWLFTLIPSWPNQSVMNWAIFG
jgi:hypothetical protein